MFFFPQIVLDTTTKSETMQDLMYYSVNITACCNFIYTYMHIHIYTHMHGCTLIWIYTHSDIWMHTYTYIRVYIQSVWVYVCLSLYACILTGTPYFWIKGQTLYFHRAILAALVPHVPFLHRAMQWEQTVTCACGVAPEKDPGFMKSGPYIGQLVHLAIPPLGIGGGRPLFWSLNKPPGDEGREEVL